MHCFNQDEVEKLISIADQYYQDLKDLEMLDEFNNFLDSENIKQMAYEGLEKKFLNGVWEIVKNRGDSVRDWSKVWGKKD